MTAKAESIIPANSYQHWAPDEESSFLPGDCQTHIMEFLTT